MRESGTGEGERKVYKYIRREGGRKMKTWKCDGSIVPKSENGQAEVEDINGFRVDGKVCCVGMIVCTILITGHIRMYILSLRMSTW